MIGSQITHYKVTAKLGAGGMGEVYRATDSKLGREVALKVLPEAFAQDSQRMARFQREAQVLASLNHPNIAAIHGLEHHERIQALAMELVEGPTLAEHTAPGPLPLNEGLTIARQIAEALEYAHEKGIIHRDLKPANIKLTPDGKVKILDFGLAKALDDSPAAQDISNSPTLSMAATKAGLILGTAAYMSPEQARGKPVDRRADIWSFGVVLYEMLTGRRAFAGEDISVTMANVIKEDPDWRALPAKTPRRIRELLRRCLAKDPRRRLQAIGDARIELEDAGTAEDVGDAPAPGVAPAATANWRARVLIAVLLLAALVAGAAFQSIWTPPPAPQPVARVAQPVPGEMMLVNRLRNVLAISPDGSKLVQVSNNRLHVRSLDSLNAVELAGTEGAGAPFFSPDGQWVGFFADGQTKKVPVNGGNAVVICSKDGFDGNWSANGTILIGTAFTGILAVSAQGGEPRVIVPPEAGVIYLKPKALPDGKSFFYVRGKSGAFDDWEGVLRSFEKDDSTVVVQGATTAVYVPTGHLLYAKLGELSVVPFDLFSRRVTGNAARIATNVDFTNAGGTSQFALSDNGTLVYLVGQGMGGERSRAAVVDRAGKASLMPLDVRDYSDPRVSPDGKFIALHLQDAQNDIWIADVARGTMSRISFAPAEDETPVWSPDGRSLAWTATRSDIPRGIFRRAADGSGNEEVLWKLDNHAHLRDWLPDGRGLLLEIIDNTTRSDIWRLDFGEKPVATAYLQTTFNERNSRISPDGRWVAYTSDESGRDEVYVQSFPAAGSKVQVSSNGGDQAVWARNGKSLFFRGGDSVQEVTIAAGPPVSVGKPRVLFPDTYESPQVMGGHTGYDVFPDGRLLMLESPDARATGMSRYQLIFVFNWFEELRRMPAAEEK